MRGLPLRDAWRLAVGTLTAIRVRPPGTVDQRTAGLAVLLAPLAVLPLGIAVAVVAVVGDRLTTPPLMIGLLGVGVLVLGTRAFHVDGLSDTADGLTASYDRERSLAAMHTGTSGPAGGVAVFLLLALQAVGIGSLSLAPHGPVLIGVLVCVSRCALALTCVRGVPAARADGLGQAYAGSVRPIAAVAVWVLAAAVTAVAAWGASATVARGLVAVLLTLVVLALLVRRCTTRLGGVTGDVFGAAVEIALTVLLVVTAGSVPMYLAG